MSSTEKVTIAVPGISIARTWFLIIENGLIPILSVPACCLWMEISFFIVLQRKTLMKNEVKEDGRVAVSALVGGTPH
jgi:hypothetical protein